MQKPRFYCLNFSLGVINPPFGTTSDNSGVAQGGKAIATPSFLKKFFNGAPLHTFHPAYQLLPDKSNYFSIINRHYQAVSSFIKSSSKSGELQISLGGDHGVSFFAIGSILERMNPQDLGIIMFDSHADLCLNGTSPSGNFHGMWARPLLGKFDVEEIDQKIPQKMPPQNWLYIGDLEGWPHFDKRELDFIKEKQITYLSKKLLTENFDRAQAALIDFLKRRRFIYVTFDIDVFTQDVAPATGLTGDWGLDAKTILPLLDIIAQSGKLIGVDLTEVNPEKEGASQTITTAQTVLLRLLKQQIRDILNKSRGGVA